MTALELIYQNTKSIPSFPAISHREKGVWKQMNWEQFGKELAQTANALKSIGVKKDSKIGIFSPNSKDWLLVDLATQMLGGITVPIYATNSQEQTEFIIDQTEMKVILTGEIKQFNIIREIKKNPKFTSLQILSSSEIEHANLDEYYFPEWTKVYEDTISFQAPSLDDTATILYTSGTTGRSKGVVLTHNNFSAVVEAHKTFFNIDNLHHKVSMAFLPLSHIFERGWSSFVLSQGGAVAVLDNPKEVSQALKEVKPWSMCSVPRLYDKIYQVLLGKIENSSNIKKKIFARALKVGSEYAELKRQGKDIPFFLNLKYKLYSTLVFKKIRNELGGNLAFMPVGGAMLQREISEFFASIGLPIVLGYGLTETTATVTAYPPVNFVHGSVGKALPGVELKIGEENEILVKYKGVMKEYYKNPEETAKVFTEDGFLRTGDAGRIDDEGNLYIIDRIKDLMKTSNGKYIAPQSIELPLQTHPSIAQALVVAEGKPYVTSFIVPNFENLSQEWEEFKDYLKMNISEKMKLLEMPNIKEKFQAIIADIQKGQSSYEQIKKFSLLPEEFTIERGELTPTLKIKRKVVMEKLRSEIDKLYNE